MPQKIHRVFYGEDPIPAKLTVSDEEFKKWARKTSKLYQTSVRWKGMQRWLSQLAQRKTRDVRGYYYLKNLKDLDESLRRFRSLNNMKEVKTSLIGICINSLTSEKKCRRDLERAIKLSRCLLYTSPSPRDKRQSRMPSSA